MFGGYCSSATYAICNVEIEVDWLEQNGGNVFGVLRPTMEIQRASSWTNVKLLYGYESYPRRLMWQWARLFNRKRRKNTSRRAFVRPLLQHNGLFRICTALALRDV